MNRNAVVPQAASPANQQGPRQGSQAFHGFEPLHSNYVFCPNQFFDICLKTNSRGLIRIVSFILRQTLGWLDADGKPVNQSVRVSYTRLQKEANVSVRAIPKAIQLAQACNFIECVVSPTPDNKAKPGSAGEYTLNWDETGAYARTISEFDGFYTGEGNRSPIPNSFFDTVVPNESLSVTKVVGAVLRHTIGYENQFGGRRMTHPLSCTTLQNFTGISDRKTIIAAIQRSIDAGYVERVQEGQFHSSRNVRAAAVYGVRWHCEANTIVTTAKTPPANRHGKKPTSTSAKTLPANHGKNPTSIEKTKPKDTLKQQAAANSNSATTQRLITEGFDSTTATRLVEKRGVAVVDRQLNWLDARKPDNRLAMLRKAIEEDWAEPASFAIKQKLATARKRDEARLAAQRSEEGITNLQKVKRRERKKRLLVEWKKASLAQRAAWIASAANRQTATTLSKIIAKQKPDTGWPKFQVLDEIALALSLPPVSEVGHPSVDFQVAKSPEAIAEQPLASVELSTFGTPDLQRKTPPKEKMSTEFGDVLSRV